MLFEMPYIDIVVYLLLKQNLTCCLFAPNILIYEVYTLTVILYYMAYLTKNTLKIRLHLELLY